MLDTTVQINLSAIRNNFAAIKVRAPNAKIIAVIKDNAYGHGLIPVAQVLTVADGFAVAHLAEALALREAGIEQRIVLLGGTLLDSAAIAHCAQHHIDLTIHDLTTLDTVCRCVNTQSRINLWLKVDTGMHRLGLTGSQIDHAIQRIKNCDAIGEYHLMTHFSSADEPDHQPTQQQMQQLLAANVRYHCALSMANSAAILRHPNSHCEWVRPGLLLYGANPLWPEQPSYLSSFQPAMTVTAPVIALRDIDAGEAVGYNRTWIAKQPTRLATVGIGYSDGYPHTAQNGTPVLVNGQRAPLVGRVSMDMITIDISACDAVKLGDPVTLWGNDLPVEEVASCADTISYDLLVRVAPRLRRIYHRDQ